MWFKIPPQQKNGGVLFCYGGSDINGFHLIVFPPGNPWSDRLTFHTPGSLIDYQNLVSKSVVTNDQWQHVALVFDGTKASVFLDGKLDASQLLRRDTSRTDSMIIGNLGEGDPYHGLHGLVDDLRFYDRALTEDEVKAIYEAEKP